MIIYTDRLGKQTFEKNVFSRERLDIIDNPIFEKLFQSEINHSNFEKVL